MSNDVRAFLNTLPTDAPVSMWTETESNESGPDSTIYVFAPRNTDRSVAFLVIDREIVGWQEDGYPIRDMDKLRADFGADVIDACERLAHFAIA